MTYKRNSSASVSPFQTSAVKRPTPARSIAFAGAASTGKKFAPPMTIAARAESPASAPPRIWTGSWPIRCPSSNDGNEIIVPRTLMPIIARNAEPVCARVNRNAYTTIAIAMRPIVIAELRSCSQRTTERSES